MIYFRLAVMFHVKALHLSELTLVKVSHYQMYEMLPLRGIMPDAMSVF